MTGIAPVRRLAPPDRNAPRRNGPCPEQWSIDQDPPPPQAGHRPLRFAVCIECGRITARRWHDPAAGLLPWCAGLFPRHEEI